VPLRQGCVANSGTPQRAAGLHGRGLADQLVQHQRLGVGAAVGIFQQRLQACGVELLAKHGIGPQALARKHPQPGVEPGGLAVDEVVAVHQHGHGRPTLRGGLGRLPRRHGARIAEDAGRIGVVQAARRPGRGSGSAGGGAPRCHASASCQAWRRLAGPPA
jgi:hypothetical protein